MLQDGYYTGDSLCGTPCILRVQHIRAGPKLGKAYLIMQDGLPDQPEHGNELRPARKAFAFLEPDNSVSFFVAFAAKSEPGELEELRRIVATIVQRHRKETP